MEKENVNENIKFYIDLENTRESNGTEMSNGDPGNVSVSTNCNSDAMTQKKTLSGRVIKPPNRLDL